jgi:hypothetical protein
LKNKIDIYKFSVLKLELINNFKFLIKF